MPPNDAVWSRLKKTPLALNTLPLRIGADSDGGSRFRGDLARARVFNRALSSNEVAALSRKEDPALLRDSALVGDWSFEQATNGAFVSQTAPHLRARIVGRTEVVEAPTGKALRFDGSGYLEIAPHPLLDLTNACTLEAWIRPDEFPAGGARIIDKSQVGTSNGYLLDTHPGNSLRLISDAGSLGYPAKLPPKRWVHVVATVAPDCQLTLYVDGRPVMRQTGSTLPEIGSLLATAERIRKFHQLLTDRGLAETYEAAHARLALESLATAHARLSLLAQGKLKPLASPGSEAAADQLYLDTARKLAEGLSQTLATGKNSSDPQKKLAGQLWQQTALESN